MRTFFQTNEQALASRKWCLVDAQDQVVGRLASKIAAVLRGKNKPTFAPHNDGGDFVVVINADKIKLTGEKPNKKIYHIHSLYPGGVKSESAEKLLARKPEEVIRRAVKCMLPKSYLGKKQFTKLFVYKGAEHPHQAQQPVKTDLL